MCISTKHLLVVFASNRRTAGGRRGAGASTIVLVAGARSNRAARARARARAIEVLSYDTCLVVHAHSYRTRRAAGARAVEDVAKCRRGEGSLSLRLHRTPGRTMTEISR